MQDMKQLFLALITYYAKDVKTSKKLPRLCTTRTRLFYHRNYAEGGVL